MGHCCGGGGGAAFKLDPVLTEGMQTVGWGGYTKASGAHLVQVQAVHQRDEVLAHLEHQLHPAARSAYHRPEGSHPTAPVSWFHSTVDTYPISHILATKLEVLFFPLKS